MREAIDIFNEPNSDIFDSPFLQEFVKQIQLHDSEQIYLDSNDLLQEVLNGASELKPKSSAKDIDSLTQLKISAFYHAVAANIEKQTGRLAQTYINLSSKKLSSALVFCGGVLVVGQMFWEIEKFGFNSVESLVTEGEKLIKNAVGIAYQYFDCTPTHANLQPI